MADDGAEDGGTSVFVAASDCLKLHVREYGTRTAPGVSVVCLPGFTRTAADFAALGRATATTTFRFDDFGTERIKQLKVSPDAFLQLGMQVAHQRTKGMIGTTYESIAVRQYYNGRVEAMRVITAELSRVLAEGPPLQGMLPICSYCKRIRHAGHDWQSVEEYIAAHVPVQFTHSICPTCY